VRTPDGTLVQGILTTLADGAAIDGAVAHPGTRGSAIQGTGWRLQAPADAPVVSGMERQRFLRMFAGVCVLLLLVVAGVVWLLARAEKLAADRVRFAATAAHELRTPLASLRLYSDLIAEEEDPLKRDHYAREVASQTERLGRLVANVLEVSRLERGTFELRPRADAIGPAVAECVQRLLPQMEAANCPIDVRVAPGLPTVAFDPDALHHVVDNLIDNAEKYSRDVPNRRIDVDVAAAADDGGGVAITISDRGPGVPAQAFRNPQPFGRQASSTSGGLGLGLFLVDRIVRGHGGSIRSVPRDGGGASVRVFLPAFYKA
jgi:signal transduction histidine kinase